MRTEAKGPTGQKSKRSIEVASYEMEDGTLVEMIESPQDTTKSLFAIWSNGRVRLVKNLECDNQIFVPVPRDAGMIRHVRLANGTEPYESAQALLESLICILHQTLELSPRQAVLLSSFVMSTWILEKLAVAPYVAFLGPPGSGKTTALRILRLLCRRSLLTSDISSAAFYEVCDRMTTTVLIDETATVNHRRELFHILRTGTSRDFVAIRKGSTFKSFGARAVSWTELPDDAALNSRCLLIPMTVCKRTDLLAPTDPRVLRAAAMLQRKLLQFRLTNYSKLTLPTISGEIELQPRTRDLFRALSLPLSENMENCEMLLKLLKPQEFLREVLSVYQSIVLESVYRAIHFRPEANSFRIAELTEMFNANLRQKGESGRFSERRFSDILSSLNLTNRTRTNAGYVLWSDRKTREEIHSLARTHGVATGLTPYMSARCELCQNGAGRPSGDSTKNPILESQRAGTNDLRELRERGVRAKRRIKQKRARTSSKLRRTLE
jgi:hypothetical protein